jgi:hypothetical protein
LGDRRRSIGLASGKEARRGMRRFGGDHYLETPEGLIAQHQRRSMRRVRFSIDGIEPRRKESMPHRDKDEVQRQLLGWLTRLRRTAFRERVALRLTLKTTDKNPTHSHHVAKNLLDLFSAPRPALSTTRRALLYADDRQVHALSVTSHHGESLPDISAVASPLGAMVQDLGLIVRHARESRDPYDRLEWEQSERLDETLDEFRDIVRDEARWRPLYGDAGHEMMLRHWRQRAQELLLGRAAITPTDLAYMYNASGRALGIDTASMWEQTFASTPLRIRLSELPQVSGASAKWKEEVDEKLRAFQSRLGWILDPLLVPVALEVVIKPPPPSRQNGLHDLDNVLRTYLIPRVVEILKPVSHYAFTVDPEIMDRTARDIAANGQGLLSLRLPRPPASTKSGVTRYEAWRLPPASEGSEGFVSIAIVTDMTGHGDIFGQVDDEIEHWWESLESPWRSTHRSGRRRSW